MTFSLQGYALVGSRSQELELEIKPGYFIMGFRYLSYDVKCFSNSWSEVSLRWIYKMWFCCLKIAFFINFCEVIGSLTLGWYLLTLRSLSYYFIILKILLHSFLDPIVVDWKVFCLSSFSVFPKIIYLCSFYFKGREARGDSGRLMFFSISCLSP